MMPLLDLSDAFDVTMMDQIVVIRREQNISSKGRSAPISETGRTVSAVVTAASPDDLARLPEAEWMGKAISIYTQYRLRGPAIGEAGEEVLPDQVLWPVAANGSPASNASVYVVRALDDFSRYGHGFVSAVAVSVKAVDYEIPNPIGNA